MKSLLSTVACIAALLMFSACPAADEQNQFFENKIRPLLVEHCYECHSAETETSEGGLLLDHQAGWQQGGDSGPALVPGDPDKSLLIEAVSYRNVDLQMPPEAKLSEAKIELLRRWIQQGAYDPRQPATESPTRADEFDLAARTQEHWCWQPIAEVAPPQVDGNWPQKDLDKFILAKLQQHELTPAAAANRRTWLRRITFATIGLPPTPEEIQAYLADTSDEAQEQVVDRLLRSPHFGEHWGQHWLDLMRFAETRGHEQDFAIPEAYRFRDYVIRAFNADVPYDQFVTEHIAGDLVEPPRLDPEDRTNQSIQGTGFWQLHDATHSPVDICGDEATRVQNQIDVFSRAFLGLSLGCARCHDHKFDAISSRDYYALYGYLQSSSYYLADVSDPERQAAVADQLAALSQRHATKLRGLLADRIVAQAANLPKYFESVRDVGGDAANAETLPHIVQQLSTKRALNKDTLWRLAKYLHGDVPAESPLKAWSMVAHGVSSDHRLIAVQRVRDSIQMLNKSAWQDLLVTRSAKDGERNYKPNDRPWTSNDIIEDFSSRDYPHWITAGHRFGEGPIPIGGILLGDRTDRPVRWFAEHPCASSESVSSKLTGMLRTRTFEVTSDKIWYRYRGSGKLFLAVDSHRVVAGPLHGVVKRDLKSDDLNWRWTSQNVRDYVGHRVHAEFTGGPDFAVDRVLFAASEPPSTLLMPPTSDVIQLLTDVAQRLRDDKLAAVDASILNWWLEHQELFPPVDDARIHTAVESYVAEKKAIEATIPTPIYALSLLDGNGEDESIHIRGNHRNRSDDVVPRGILAAFGTLDTRDERGSGRLAMARKLTDPENPLLARVYVNRVWHHLFGRGIVETVDDFGVMGKAPTHPELLDYLAQQFMHNGWSTKWLIRELLLSSTYQMSSHPDPKHEAIDPTNRYWHRMPVRRLTGEVIRDHLLAVSGRLDRKQFGKSVTVHITPFMRGNRTPKASGPVDGDGRRSIYTEVRRNHLPAFLAAFDKPPPFMAIGRRTVSNSPTQSLILLNDPFVHEQALRWAKRLMNADADRRLATAFEQAFAREPERREVKMATAFLNQQQQVYTSDDATKQRATELAWRDLCHTLINVKEFIHVN